MSESYDPAAPRRRALLVGAGLAVASAGLRAAPTPDGAWPTKALTLVVPFPAGGGADNLARLVMPRVSRVLGQNIVIDNRAGAGGNIGAEYVAHAAPDGYTLLYGTNGTHSINASLYRSMRFDPQRDFVPISRMTEIATMLIVHPQLPVTTTAELIRYAKANPGKLNFASAGNGTTSHLAGEMFRTQANIDIVHVPYRGGALAMTDLIAGHVQMMIEVMPNAWPQVRDGRVRGLAVASPSRFPGAPGVPTIDESGLPGFEASAWDGLFAPAGTPAPIVARMNAAVRQTLEDGEVAAALFIRGARPVPGTPESFAQFIAASSERWGVAVRASGAKID